MYTVLFPTGRTEVFRVKALADTYVLAFKGILISAPLCNESLKTEKLGLDQ